MNEVLEAYKIEDMIYEIDGKQVMLDSDLAKLYHVETKRINEAVYRNKEKFPERFSWIVNKEELESLWSQNATANISSKSRVNPRVFTKEGVAMLATILKSKVAVEVSIKIMDTFVKMRKYISKEINSMNIIHSKLLEHDNRIQLLEESFNKFDEKQKISTIFFEGQIYDAYSFLLDILYEAKKEIIIIDNYVNHKLLNLLKNIDVQIIVVSKNIEEELQKKYQAQYSNIIFIPNKSFHDRFLLLDKKCLYHSGASFKDIGEKCFAITKIEEKEYIDQIIQNI